MSAGRSASAGLRNGFRPWHVQTAEGELRIEVPQAREAVMPFVSKLFPKWHCKRLLRTDPLKALVIGGFVRGLSMRDIESLCEEAGLGRALALSAQTPRTVAINEPARTLTRGGPPAHQSDGPVPRETSCLSLVWAVLDLFFSHASNGATFTADVDRQHLYRIKYQQADPDTLDEEVTAA
jgi:hypothetical protein